MSGCHVSLDPASANLILTDSFERSHFSKMSDELIFKIFKNNYWHCFPELRLVCKTFKRIAEDHILLKKENAALEEALGMLEVLQGEGEVFARDIDQGVERIPLTMFRLRASLREKLMRLTKQQIARHSFDTLSAREAPLFQRFIKEEYLDVLQRHFESEMQIRGAGLTFDYSISPDNLLFFGEVMKRLPQIPSIELHCELNETDALFIAEAFAAGLFPNTAVRIRGNQQFDRGVFLILLNGVARSPHVKALSLVNCSLFGEVFGLIRGALEGKSNIESLSLNDFAFSDENLETVAEMLELHPEIRSLSLTGCSNQEVREFLKKINRTHLIELGIVNSDIREDTIEYLIRHLSELTQIAEFNLERNKLSNESIELLSDAAKTLQRQISLKLPEKRVDLGLLRELKLLI